MASKKPLIFLEPLSESLKKLREIMEQTKEQDGLEIFSFDALNEFAQAGPSLGASLVISSQPKKCAMMLKGMGKRIQKMNSKVMLLSDKKIPQKTLEKLMKIGLTECVVEPIAPKTLLYKVKLLLRSLPSGDKQAKEMSLKSIEGAKKQQEGDGGKKFDKDAPESEQEEIAIKEKKKAQVIDNGGGHYEGDVDDEAAPEDLGGHYEGQGAGADQVDSEELASKGDNKVDHIDTHYEGDLAQDQGPQEEAKAPHEGQVDHLGTLESELLKRGDLSMDLVEDPEDAPLTAPEEEKGPKATKNVSLDMDLEDDAGPEVMSRDELKGMNPLKGKIGPNLHMGLEEDVDFMDKAPEDAAPGAMKSKDSQSLAMDLEDDGPVLTQEAEEGPTAEMRGGDLSKTPQAPEADAGPHLTPEERPADGEADPNEGKVDHIDKYYRNDAARPQDVIESGPDELKRADLDMGLEGEGPRAPEENGQDSLEASSAKLKKAGLDGLVEDDEAGSLAEASPEETMANYSKREKAQDVTADYDPKAHKAKLKEEAQAREGSSWEEMSKNEASKARKSSGLEVEDDTDFGPRDGNGQAPEKEARSIERKAREAKESRGGRGRPKREEAQDGWDGLGKSEDKGQVLDFPQAEHNKELIIQKAQLGEQTIDYGRLKEEFDIIQKYGHGAIKDAYQFGVEGSEEARALLRSGKVPYTVEISEDGPPKLVPIPGEEDRPQRIFEPDSKGLEYAVEALGLVEDKKVPEEQVLSFISGKILTEYVGHTAFYRVPHRGSKMDLLHAIDSEFMRELYPALYEEGFSQWRQENLPKWSDETFQERPMRFVYPFYEGTNAMGLAVAHFPEGISQQLASRVEILLECARGAYLDEFHGRGHKGSYGRGPGGASEQGEGKKEGLIKGIWNLLWGRKSA